MRFTEVDKQLTFFSPFLAGLLCGIFLISVSCQTNQEKVEVVLKKCESFLEKDELDKATICYADAIKSNPEQASEISKRGKESFYKKCNFYKDREDYERAIVCFEGFTILDSQSAHAYFQLAENYYQFYLKKKVSEQENFEFLNRAEKAIISGIRIKNEDANAHALYAQILTEIGRLEHALIEYKIASEINPQIALFRINIGFIEQRLNKNEEALKSYKQALLIEPNNTVALYYLGSLYEKLDEIENAIRNYESLLKIKPDDVEVKERLEMLKKSQKPRL